VGVIALLDTNVCIAVMRDPVQADRLKIFAATDTFEQTAISSITLYELEAGIVGRKGEIAARASLDAFLDGPIYIAKFDDHAARASARLSATVRAKGQQLSAMDTLIAGHAAALDAILITSDDRLRSALPEGRVVGW
jgi:tRNA(fMet)-specific endonuclease VapC